MNVKIEESWKNILSEEWNKDYFIRLTDFVRNEYATTQIFPPGKEIFAAFDATPFDNVKVVIIGQDPYHDVNQANGLCFSVRDGIPFPPSLLNIFKEIQDFDLFIKSDFSSLALLLRKTNNNHIAFFTELHCLKIKLT